MNTVCTASCLTHWERKAEWRGGKKISFGLWIPQWQLRNVKHWIVPKNTSSSSHVQPGNRQNPWIVLGMNKLATLRSQSYNKASKQTNKQTEKTNLDCPLSFFLQDCQTLCQTHMPSKQVLISSACRCMRSAVQLRRTVWPGNLRCQKWFTSSVCT